MQLMTRPCLSYQRVASVGCLCLFVNGCRSEAGAPDGKGRAAGAAQATPSVSVSPTSAPAMATREPAVNAAPAVAVSANAAAQDGECAGPLPLGSPLPHFEQRKLNSRKEGYYRFELAYPVFQEAREKVAQKINRQLLERLTAIQKRFLKEAEATNGAPDPDNARWYEGKCDVAFYSPSFASVGCETMEGPGAHPNLDKFAINFEICPDVRRLTLADLCRELPECRKKIIELINQDFRTGKKKETGIQFRDGPGAEKVGAPDMEHPVVTLREFGITPVGLRLFLFDELPHVLQAFAIVDIPAAKVRPVLRDDVARRIWGP